MLEKNKNISLKETQGTQFCARSTRTCKYKKNRANLKTLYNL